MLSNHVFVTLLNKVTVLTKTSFYSLYLAFISYHNIQYKPSLSATLLYYRLSKFALPPHRSLYYVGFVCSP